MHTGSTLIGEGEPQGNHCKAVYGLECSSPMATHSKKNEKPTTVAGTRSHVVPLR